MRNINVVIHNLSENFNITQELIEQTCKKNSKNTND